MQLASPRGGEITVKEADRLTIGRILKANHAGEYGAIRIYRAQLWVARRLYPDVAAFLEETLAHEIRHCAMLRQAMSQKSAPPSRVISLWGNGGLILGFFTSLLGRQGIWICTAAVESTVHKHLDDQLIFCAVEMRSCARLSSRLGRKRRLICTMRSCASRPGPPGPSVSSPPSPD